MAWWPVGKLSTPVSAQKKRGEKSFDLCPSRDLLIEFPVLANKRGRKLIIS